MSRIKVVHIATVDRSLRYLLLDQLCSLRQDGYEVLAISSPGQEVPALEQAGIRHIAVPMTRTFTPLADLVSLWRLVRVMRREGFTIVHTHTPKPGLLGQLAARLARVPIVVNTLHGLYFHEHMTPGRRRFYITTEKIAARCSDVILSQNSEDIRTAIDAGVTRPESIKHLGNGIDLGRFNPDRVSAAALRQQRARLGVEPETPVIGFVGRLAAKRKGFLDFLAAGALVAEQIPGVRFLIVGEADAGKPDAVDPSAAKAYGIADRCIFLGQRPNYELPVLYRLMHVLALPSLFEGIPRVLMEASAMRTPVVATDVKGNREAVIDGRNGLLMPLGDVQSLAAALIEILSDPVKARRMGDEGRRMAEQCFDQRIVFDRVKAEYTRLLHAKGINVARWEQRM